MARPTRKYGARRRAAPAPAEPAGAYLIDAHNYIFRAFHGVPSFTSGAGRPTNATYGFIRTLLMLVREHPPALAACIFEGPPTRRTALYPAYKQNRAELPPALGPQFADCRRAAAALGFQCLESAGYEADDLMGTLAAKLAAAGEEVVLVSGDKDLAQLVTDRITLYDVARDEAFDLAGVKERFGVPPARIPDLLALTGDPIDNIPGIPGIGDKTAVALLAAFGSLPAILADPARIADLDLRNARAVAEKVSAAGDQPRLGLELATIATDAPIAIDLATLAYRGAHRAELEPLCAELDFGPRIRAEVPIWAGEPRSELALDFGGRALDPAEEEAP
jgi:5'-3' exonuclease